MANPLVADIIKQARLYLRDKDGVKWTDEALVAYLNTGKGMLYDKTPSAFYVTSIVTSEPADVSAEDEIAVSSMYSEPLAHYIAAQALLEAADDEYNRNLAKDHMKQSGIAPQE